MEAKAEGIITDVPCVFVDHLIEAQKKAYKTSRRVLLQNLSGNSAWKSGHGKAGAENE